MAAAVSALQKAVGPSGDERYCFVHTAYGFKNTIAYRIVSVLHIQTVGSFAARQY
jgi:hypothetical protein